MRNRSYTTTTTTAATTTTTWLVLLLVLLFLQDHFPIAHSFVVRDRRIPSYAVATLLTVDRISTTTLDKDNNQHRRHDSSITTTRLSAATGLSLGGDLSSSSSSNAAARRDEELSVPGNKEGNKVGVLFLNLGGPTTGEDVEGTVAVPVVPCILCGCQQSFPHTESHHLVFFSFRFLSLS